MPKPVDDQGPPSIHKHVRGDRPGPDRYARDTVAVGEQLIVMSFQAEHALVSQPQLSGKTLISAYAKDHGHVVLSRVKTALEESGFSVGEFTSSPDGRYLVVDSQEANKRAVYDAVKAVCGQIAPAASQAAAEGADAPKLRIGSRMNRPAAGERQP